MGLMTPSLLHRLHRAMRVLLPLELGGVLVGSLGRVRLARVCLAKVRGLRGARLDHLVMALFVLVHLDWAVIICPWLW